MTKLCLDNTFVSDYLNGYDYTKRFLLDLPDSSEVYIPTLVKFETFVPAFQSGGSRSMEKAKRALSGFRPIGFSEDHAEEAAEIRANLIDGGQKIGAPDVLIAGISRNMDAEIVTSDGHFDRVPGLSVRDPQS